LSQTEYIESDTYLSETGERGLVSFLTLTSSPAV